MAFLSRGVLAALFVTSMTAFAQAADRAIIVLDASGSMWGQIDGRPKVDIAREALRTVLQSVPADTELGLMGYGHREKGSCTDIELVVPPAAGTASAITGAADTMKFFGKTPLTAAVRQAADALKSSEGKSTVILVTDGVESCEANPCALGKELKASGADLTVHVVGFGLTAEEGREVACLAEDTGGKYLEASDAAGLKDALAAAVAAPSKPAAAAAEPEPAPAAEPAPPAVTEPAPAPERAPEPAKPEFNLIPAAVMAAGGEPVKDGNAWEIFRANPDGGRGEQIATEYGDYKGSLEPGDYIVAARLGEARAEQKLKVEPGQVYTPAFVLNAGTLIVRPRANEGGEVSGAASVEIEYPGGAGASTNYGETKVILPAGKQKLTVKLGTGEVSETIDLAAGQTVEKDVVVGVGRVTVNAVYAAGGDKVDASGLDIKIFKRRLNVDDTRDQVSYAFGPDAKFDLAPGDHVAVLRMDQAEAEQPFNIRAGENKDVTVVLDAGVLAISAPGARDIKVLASKKGVQGERKEVAYGFGETLQTTLPAGDYVITTDRRDGSPVKETPAAVKPGGRLELTVP